MRQRQPLRQEADIAEITDDALRETAGPPTRAGRSSPADACGCAGRSAPNSPLPPPTAASSTTARRPGQAGRRPWGPISPRQWRRSVRYRLAATSARGRTVLRSFCGRRWQDRPATVLHRRTRQDSGRARQARTRCGYRHRTPPARSLWLPRPAASCRSGGCNGSSSPHTRPAPNAPAPTPRSDRDRPACRART